MNNNRTVKRLTENEPNESDEPSSESEDSIHHIKEIKKIDETNKHFTTALKINGILKEFIFDTGLYNINNATGRKNNIINRNTEKNKSVPICKRTK